MNRIIDSNGYLQEFWCDELGIWRSRPVPSIRVLDHGVKLNKQTEPTKSFKLERQREQK